MNALQLKDNTVTLRPRQREILDFVLKFRHLNQKQIQNLLGHKAKERVRIWLNDLVLKGYLIRSFTKEIGSRPTEYCLGKKSVGYFRRKGGEWIDELLIKRLYYEDSHTRQYRDHCMLVADIYLSLLEHIKVTSLKFLFETKTSLHGIR